MLSSKALICYCIKEKSGGPLANLVKEIDAIMSQLDPTFLHNLSRRISLKAKMVKNKSLVLFLFFLLPRSSRGGANLKCILTRLYRHSYQAVLAFLLSICSPIVYSTNAPERPKTKEILRPKWTNCSLYVLTSTVAPFIIKGQA